MGLGFGAEFIPIYQAHPDAELVALCQRGRQGLDRIADEFGVEGRYTDYLDMLRHADLDAVHINTPIALHAQQSILGLEAGKHVACTVPMATSIEDCQRVVAAQIRSGRSFMMMETAVYTREFKYVQELVQDGRFGRLQFLRGAHMQEMAAWPHYWRSMAPMHYATHAVAPLLALAGRPAESVRCLASGRVTDPGAGNRWDFAVQTALFKLSDSDMAVEVTRSLFDVAREYVESFDVYGERMSFEWQQLERERPVVFTGEEGARVEIPDFAHQLPQEIRGFTTQGVYDVAENTHLSFAQGSGHGGSHPHLAHEFIRSIIEERPPFPDARTAANWTCAGLCAHESAMTGREVMIPEFAVSGVRTEVTP